MKLAFKIFIWAFLSILVVLSVDGYLELQRVTDQFQSDMIRDGERIARNLAKSIEIVWNTDGQTQAMDFVDQVNNMHEDMTISVVSIVPKLAGIPQADLVSSQRSSVRDGQVVSDTDADDGSIRTYIALAPDDGFTGYALQLSESRSPIISYRENTVLRMIILIFLSLVVSGIAIALTSVRVIGVPIRQLVQQAESIGAGKLGNHSHVKGRDELSVLGSSMNQMSSDLLRSREQLKDETEAKIALLEQLRHGDRLKTVGKLSSGVAHELGTPLNIIMGRAGMILSDDAIGEETRTNATVVREQVDRMTKIIKNLLSFSRRDVATKDVFDLNEVVSKTTKLLSPLAKKRNTDIRTNTCDDPLRVRISTQHIEQVLSNIVNNSIDAMPDGGTVVISTKGENKKRSNVKGSRLVRVACVQIADDGIGMEPEEVDMMFDPFYTTKEVGQGTGLGLAIAHGIIDEHGGWIEVTSSPGEGTQFSVMLPVVNES